MLRRILCFILAASTLFSYTSHVHAAYSSLVPPTGWESARELTERALFRAGASPTSVSMHLGRLTASAVSTTTVAGASVAVPVTMRYASNAAEFAAKRLFLPAVLLSLTGSALVGVKEWGETAGLKLITDPATREKRWENLVQASGPASLPVGVTYSINDLYSPRSLTPSAVCPEWEARVIPDFGILSLHPVFVPQPGRFGDCRVTFRTIGEPNIVKNYGTYSIQQNPFSCPTGYIQTANRCALQDPNTRPGFVPEDEFLQRIKIQPMPIGLPQKLPFGLPVEDPIMNPSTTGQPRPVWIPTGEPYLEPKVSPTDPDVWVQPGVQVTTAPTVSNPWRVDSVQKPRKSTTPSSQRDPLFDPLAPSATALPSGPRKPKEEDAEEVGCGLPTTPPCKIDEQGTPENPKLDESKKPEDITKSLKDFAEDPLEKLPDLPLMNWSFRLPTGCSAIQLPVFAPYLTSVDVCPFTPVFHDVMTIVWIMGGIFGAISIFWRNVFAP